MGYTLTFDWSARANSTGARPRGVLGFCVHHAAGTSLDMAGTFLANDTSANYGVKDGEVRQFVEDVRGTWHAGDLWANENLLSIECCNCGGAAEGWPVSERTVDTLVELLADKCKEHGIGSLEVGRNLFGHRDFFATFCPGVLYPRLNEIADRVNSTLMEGEPEMITDNDVARIAQQVWDYDIESVPAYWHQFNSAVNAVKAADAAADTSDPTGRGYELTTHDHVKYLGAKLSDVSDKLDKLIDALGASAKVGGTD